MRFDTVPVDSSCTERRRDALQPTLHGMRIELAEQPGEVLPGHPADEAGRSGLTDNEPPLRASQVLGSVEHDGLSGAASTGV